MQEMIKYSETEFVELKAFKQQDNDFQDRLNLTKKKI